MNKLLPLIAFSVLFLVPVGAQQVFAAGVLYGVNQDGDVFTIDTTTGAATVVGNYFAQGSFAEIECPSNSINCFLTTGGDAFVPNAKTIAPITLSAVPTVGPPSPQFPFPVPALEYVGNILYGADINGDLFIITNPTTAATSPIGNMGFRASGLAYDTVNGKMYVMDGISADLYTVDLTDATVTFIGNTQTGEVGSIEFGPDGKLYGGGNTCADSPPNLPFGGAGDIFTIDTSTGVATRVGPTGLPPITLGSCRGEPSVSGLTLVTTTLIGGELLPIDNTALLLASVQSFSWMIPVLLSAMGIGLFVASRKSK